MNEQPMDSGAIDRLRSALLSIEEDFGSPASPTFGRLVESLGSEGAALAATLLALPFLSPVSMGALTAPASFAIGLLGVQVMRESAHVRLPGRLVGTKVPRALHTAMLTVLRLLGRIVDSFSRPRTHHLVGGRRGRVICGLGLICGAVLLAVPIPFLPLTNTIPSFAIICFGVGWAEQDGVVTLVGAWMLLLGTLLFAGIGIATAFFGAEALQAVLPMFGR